MRTWLRDQPDGWELMSGAWSPFYVNFRDAPADPELFRFLVDAGAELVREELPEATQLVGLAAAGVPFAAGFAYELGLPLGYTRKLPGVRRVEDLDGGAAAESYGSHRLVEGDFRARRPRRARRRPRDRLRLEGDRAAPAGAGAGAARASRTCAPRPSSCSSSAAPRRAAAPTPPACGSSRCSCSTRDSVEGLRGAASDRELDVIAAYLRDPAPFQDAGAPRRADGRGGARRAAGGR